MSKGKKRVLFMISNLDSGGVSKSMVNLLNEIDRKRYDINLWVGTPSGLYSDLLPKDLRVIQDNRIAHLLAGARGIAPLLYRCHFLLALGSCFRLLLACVSKAWAGWWLSRLMPPLSEEYDVVIDYNGQHQLYYMVDKIKAARKITFFHSDYKRWPYYYSVDKQYFPHADAICTISRQCVRSLAEVFPDIAHKVYCIENISSPGLILKMAQEGVADVPTSTCLLVTVGHVSEKKGSDMAIQAAALMQQQGVEFQWLFVGTVSDEQKYKTLIRRFNLHKRIHLVGIRKNPYPYMDRTTMIVHPSQFEGKSMALDEAKILCKPIVVTNFSTVSDQFEDGVNATICEMTPESLSAAIMDLLNDPDKRNQYSTWLREHMVDNRTEINKIYALIDEA